MRALQLRVQQVAQRPQTFLFVLIPLLFLTSLLLLFIRTQELPSQGQPPGANRLVAPLPDGPTRSPVVDLGLDTTAPPASGDRPPSAVPSTPPPTAADAGSKDRAQAVREAFRRAWAAYKGSCWGRDELRPVSRTCHSWGGFGLTIVDSLDTALLMDLEEESKEGLEWIRSSLSFDQPADVSTFEITIRLLGGLLSAHALSGEQVLLDKARDLGDRLLRAFETPSGLPHSTVNLRTGRAYSAAHLGANVALSEAGTLSMEFTYLSHITGDARYAEKVAKVTRLLDALPKWDGLYSATVNRESGGWGSLPRVTLGALGDSFYEYLLKMWLLTGQQASGYLRMYEEAARGILAHMLQHSDDSPPLLYLAELTNRQQPLEPIPKMDHLVCFAAGMFALGAHAAPSRLGPHMEPARGVALTCTEMYRRQALGLAPEIVKFAKGQGMFVDVRDRHYLLRPETAEALFVLWSTTGETQWRDLGWAIFEAIERACAVPSGGYSGVRDVTTQGPAVHDDLQQSFFLAETLKYLYLLFSPPDLLPLDRYVFNTEAHPLPVFTPSPALLHALQPNP